MQVFDVCGLGCGGGKAEERTLLACGECDDQNNDPTTNENDMLTQVNDNLLPANDPLTTIYDPLTTLSRPSNDPAIFGHDLTHDLFTTVSND